MLQNLKLDLLKFRSSGLGSQMEDNTSATQEARALSRDIGHAVEAAEELKKTLAALASGRRSSRRLGAAFLPA